MKATEKANGFPSAPAPTKEALLALAGIVLLALAIRAYFFVGSVGSDDLSAWNRAAEFARGNWGPLERVFNPIATYRYGLSLPVAIVFFLFGESSHTAGLFPLVCSLITVVLVWDITRRLGAPILAVHAAGLLAALNGLDVRHATLLLPDAVMNAFGFLAIWLAIIGYQWEEQGRNGASLIYTLAGLAAAYSVFSKEAGIIFIIALGAWFVTNLALREATLKQLFGLVGFVAGVAAESLFFYVLHGDLLHRWWTIETSTARNTALYEQAIRTGTLSYPTSLFGKTNWFFSHLLNRLPGAVLLMGAGVVATVYLVFVRMRQGPIRLVIIVFAVALAFRVPELTSTFSFQPRRYLPMVTAACILIPLAASQIWPYVMLRPKWARALTGAAMALVLGLFVYLTFNDDWTTAALNANKLRVEKELVTWTERHTQLLTPRTPLYTDRRTARILNFLGGSNIPLGALDTYPFHWELTGEKLLKPVPPNFSLGVSSAPSHVVPTKADMEGGFWAINPRVVKWLAQPPRLDHVGLDVYAADIPETWCFLSVLGGETATPGALFEIPSRVTAKRQTHDLPLDIVAGLRDGTWHIFPTTETITPTENGFGVTLERDHSIRLMSEPLD